MSEAMGESIAAMRRRLDAAMQRLWIAMSVKDSLEGGLAKDETLGLTFEDLQHEIDGLGEGLDKLEAAAKPADATEVKR